MKKLLLSTLVAVLFFPMKLKADEGMWFLMFIERLNHRDMQKEGLQLTAEEIYSINNNSLKDAIVQLIEILHVCYSQTRLIHLLVLEPYLHLYG